MTQTAATPAAAVAAKLRRPPGATGRVPQAGTGARAAPESASFAGARVAHQGGDTVTEDDIAGDQVVALRSISNPEKLRHLDASTSREG